MSQDTHELSDFIAGLSELEADVATADSDAAAALAIAASGGSGMLGEGDGGNEELPLIPGPAGPPGATGASGAGTGSQGPPGMDGEPGEDAPLMGLPTVQNSPLNEVPNTLGVVNYVMAANSGVVLASPYSIPPGYSLSIPPSSRMVIIT